MAYDLPEGTAHHLRAPWNRPDVPSSYEQCAACFETHPRSDMYKRERWSRRSKSEQTVYLCFSCVPKCLHRDSGDVPVCLEVLEEGEGLCLKHGIEITLWALGTYERDGDTESADEERAELARLRAKERLA